MSQQIKTGFVGIVGPTNSGKSTLMNGLVGEKVSIVSPRVQTTYHAVRGILNSKEEQIVFTDTPGFQSHPNLIPRLLNKVADRQADECELLLWVFDASSPRVLEHIEKMKEKIKKLKEPSKSLCILNKVDKIAKPALLPLIAAIAPLELFAEIIPVSALQCNGLSRILEVIRREAKEGQPLYDREASTDRPMTFMASEFIREQIYEATREEIPYAARVEIEQWENPSEGRRMPEIHATIHVDSDSQKGILIGRGGDKLKNIGTKARESIEKLTGAQIVLKLRVDVQSGWTGDRSQVQSYLEL